MGLKNKVWKSRYQNADLSGERAAKSKRCQGKPDEKVEISQDVKRGVKEKFKASRQAGSSSWRQSCQTGCQVDGEGLPRLELRFTSLQSRLGLGAMARMAFWRRSDGACKILSRKIQQPTLTNPTIYRICKFTHSCSIDMYRFEMIWLLFTFPALACRAPFVYKVWIWRSVFKHSNCFNREHVSHVLLLIFFSGLRTPFE